jgi:hypothetical protein
MVLRVVLEEHQPGVCPGCDGSSHGGLGTEAFLEHRLSQRMLQSMGAAMKLLDHVRA